MPFSIILFDVDHFKKYNDIFGHLKGDQILISVAKIIQGELRQIDCLARYGGEEFLVILPESSGEVTFHVAERIRRRIELETNISISLGITTYKEGLTIEQMLNQSDKALYYAKRQGRNNSIIYE